MLPIQTILLPTDFSPYSDTAFRLACSVARDYGARLILLHVVSPPVMVYGEGVLPVDPVENRNTLLERLQELASRALKIPVDHRVVEGDAATVILQVAEETKCDLIVMGTHGRTGLGRLLMGSVAEKVSRRAPCPVLTVKTPHEKETPSERPTPAKTGKGTVAVK
jgi:nucleotide-binding universal stress UspA family protein